MMYSMQWHSLDDAVEDWDTEWDQVPLYMVWLAAWWYPTAEATTIQIKELVQAGVEWEDVA